MMSARGPRLWPNNSRRGARRIPCGARPSLLRCRAFPAGPGRRRARPAPLPAFLLELSSGLHHDDPELLVGVTPLVLTGALKHWEDHRRFLKPEPEGEVAVQQQRRMGFGVD